MNNRMINKSRLISLILTSIIITRTFSLDRRSLRGYVTVQQTVPLPPVIQQNFADSTSPLKSSDTPVYWHILKSGGTTMKHTLKQCMNLKIVDEKSRGIDHFADVDTSTIEGIEKAKSLHLTESGLIDVIITPHIHEIASMFNPEHQGRIFAMIRHPIDRAVSLFYYLQHATWEPSYDPSLKDMSIESYAMSDKVEENWMTRFLVNKKSEPIGPSDVVVAKEIIRSKFIVGLLSRPHESMNRFMRFLGWKAETPEIQQCINDMMTIGVNRHEHALIEREGKVWNQLLEHNKYDMELYQYVVQLFHEQASSISLSQSIMDF